MIVIIVEDSRLNITTLTSTYTYHGTQGVLEVILNFISIVFKQKYTSDLDIDMVIYYQHLIPTQSVMIQFCPIFIHSDQ